MWQSYKKWELLKTGAPFKLISTAYVGSLVGRILFIELKNVITPVCHQKCKSGFAELRYGVTSIQAALLFSIPPPPLSAATGRLFRHWEIGRGARKVVSVVKAGRPRGV